jgi:hypothetical protein
MFDNMLEIHRPEIWINGHWHIQWEEELRGVRHIGLGELTHIDLEA